MEAELQERVESSCKQANRVADIYTSLKDTVDQLKKTVDSGIGERGIVGCCFWGVLGVMATIVLSLLGGCSSGKHSDNRSLVLFCL